MQKFSTFTFMDILLLLTYKSLQATVTQQARLKVQQIALKSALKVPKK